ncbi:hypothetical protein LPJ59_000491 [Coemansia sp. RSA 2399]|nr:hypothetical protein LPJ59_000491 [Coemansia sp. RSA 2399]KAJ1907974.1 hypothetical protein LPJ81_000403 [Coemansia sp. IMI 209127]
MDSEVVAQKTGREPAMFVGGRRVSLPSVPPHPSQKEDQNGGGKDARDEEGEPMMDLIRQDEDYRKALHDQTQKQQQREMKNNKYTNAELNHGPHVTKMGNIRQPQRFASGLPLESRQILSKMDRS